MLAGIDIGGTKIGVGLVDETMRVVARAECATEPEAGFTAGIERILRLFGELGVSRTAGGIRGVGIGCTGPVDPATGEIRQADLLPGWEGSNLKRALGEAMDVPVEVENDADAGALAEWRLGTGGRASRFVYVTVGTGIGAGIILDGEIYRGAAGMHPELGHQTIDDSGPACYCGANGCWEAMASGPAMVRWAAALGLTGRVPAERVTAKSICARAAAGDPLALQVVEKTAYYLGVGLANVVTMFYPERIALGGGVMASWPLFRDPVLRAIESRCRLTPCGNTAVAPASAGPDTPLLGAALVFEHRAGR